MTGHLAATGVPRVDASIAKVNAIIGTRGRDAWWLPETIVVQGVHGRFRTRRLDHVTRQLVAFGAHTRNEIAMLLAFLRPGDQVIDVGAHLGSFTVPFARAVGPSGRVLSIEADGESFALLVENVARNGTEAWVRPFCAVAAEHAGSYRAVTAAPDHTSATHYVPDPDGLPSVCVRLDALASNLDPSRPLRLIKIDVEGMELTVLRSAAELIRAHRPLLYVEVGAIHLQRQGVTVGDLEEFLSAQGYAFFRNVGPRNSTSDRYQIAHLGRLADGSDFFDCLAVPGEHLDREAALPALRARAGPSPLRRIWRRWRAPAGPASA